MVQKSKCLLLADKDQFIIYTINTTAANDLAMQGAMISRAMFVVSCFSWNILVWAPEKLRPSATSLLFLME